MALMYALSSFALRQVVGEGAENVLRLLSDRLTDQSQLLPRALQQANERAWKALEVTLAGEGLLNKLDSAEEKAFRQQIRALLDTMPLPLLTGKTEFRKNCHRELLQAKKSHLLLGPLQPPELAKSVEGFARHGNQTGMLEADRAALQTMGVLLEQSGCKNLAQLIAFQVQPDQSLLVVAVRYFFRRAVETDEILSRGLQFTMTEALTQQQKQAFQQLEQTFHQFGDRLDRALADLQGVLSDISESLRGVEAGQSHINQEVDELKRMMQQLLTLYQMEQQREVRPGTSRSIRGEGDRRRVREVVDRYRALPHEQRRQRPELLNTVGLLEVAAGDCVAAERDFEELAELVGNDARAQGQAHFNRYRAALERRDWPVALEALRTAVQFAPAEYAPFPFGKFAPERILGAGGFGVAFLCQHRRLNQRVVIKSLQLDGLDRDVSEVFSEAQLLRSLRHPAIIELSDCDFADEQGTRAYLVMEYFEGVNLGEHIKQQGMLTGRDLLPLARAVAEGLRAAHKQRIFHRDIKPDNLLVRKKGECWEMKLIDFGLALKQEVSEGTVRTPGGITPSPNEMGIAGTLEYAAPEQIGQLTGVPVGSHSDVYGFGRTCYYALLGTPQPDDYEKEMLDEGWRKLLADCTARKMERRLADFDAVLQRLTELERTAARTPRSSDKPALVRVPRPQPPVSAAPVPSLEIPPADRRPPSRPSGPPPRVPPRVIAPIFQPPPSEPLPEPILELLPEDIELAPLENAPQEDPPSRRPTPPAPGTRVPPRQIATVFQSTSTEPAPLSPLWQPPPSEANAGSEPPPAADSKKSNRVAGAFLPPAADESSAATTGRDETPPEEPPEKKTPTPGKKGPLGGAFG